MIVRYDLRRGDGRLERTCEHGIGHTVGHHRGYLLEHESIHGCDGCCRSYEHQSLEPCCWECGATGDLYPRIFEHEFLCGPCWQSEKMMYAREEAEDRVRDFPEDEYYEPRS